MSRDRLKKEMRGIGYAESGSELDFQRHGLKRPLGNLPLEWLKGAPLLGATQTVSRAAVVFPRSVIFSGTVVGVPSNFSH